MAYGRNRILYRRNILPAAALKGQRVFDIKSGALAYTIKCVAYRGGFTNRTNGPDIDPRTNGVDESNSPGPWIYGNLNGVPP